MLQGLFKKKIKSFEFEGDTYCIKVLSEASYSQWQKFCSDNAEKTDGPVESIFAYFVRHALCDPNGKLLIEDAASLRDVDFYKLKAIFDIAYEFTALDLDDVKKNSSMTKTD